MKCDRVKELLLTDHADGEIKAASKEAVRLHLEGCAGCRELERKIKAARAAFRSVKPEAVPPHLWYRIKEAVSVKEAKKSAVPLDILGTLKDLLFGPRYVFARATAAALVIFIVVFAGFAAHKYYIESPAYYQNVAGMESFDINGADAASDMGTEIEKYFL